MPNGSDIPGFIEQERTVPGRWIVLGIVIFSTTVISIAMTWMHRNAGTNAPPPPSIAVLPFADLSAAKDQQYLCDGMTAQIIDAVSRIPGFLVIARNSVFQLPSQDDAREAGRKLNVRTILQGSVQRSGSRIHVTAQLVNTADGFHLWSQTYDRDVNQIFTVEDEISRAIVDNLQIKLPAPLRPVPRTSLEAFDLYLEGRYAQFQSSPPEVERAIALFDQAVQKDPQYAPAWSGLADSYVWLALFRARPADVMPKARAAAERAIQIDPLLDAAYITRAEVKSLYDYDWPGAQQDFDHALLLNPVSSRAMFAHALVYLAPQGRTKEAIAEMKQSRDFDPLNPETSACLGAIYMFDRQYALATEQLQQTVARNPNYPAARVLLQAASIAAGKPVEAGAAHAASGLSEIQILLLEGKKSAAEARLADWKQAAPETYVSPVSIAAAYFALGEFPQGLDQLDLAWQRHDPLLAFAKVWPALDPARFQPRFKSLLAKLHLGD